MSGKLRVLMALSLAGMVLLPLFGLLLRFQPSFVHGLRVDAAKAERNCYLAAGCYGVMFMVSAVALCVHTRHEKQREILRRAAAEDAILGKKMRGGKTSDDKSNRNGSRSSSREDTTIMLDSPYDGDHAHL